MIINNKKTAHAIYRHIVNVFGQKKTNNITSFYYDYVSQVKALEMCGLKIDYTDRKIDVLKYNPNIDEKRIDSIYKMFSVVLFMYKPLIKY